ncbi:MAG: beta-galactosidase [Planctomycetota bacterium]
MTQVEPIHIGASWYPECWSEAEWPADIERMREIGFTIVRLFEFAWHRFEPREGEYDFDWALRLLDRLHKAGIVAIIGTPTAAPPAWLTSTYPEVLRTGPDGQRLRHGRRKHYNHQSRLYRKLALEIVEQMCEAFAGHPALHAWQIDNEMSGFDYGEETTRHFHAWLEDRYGTVDHLNRAWGLEFWSQAYQGFDQIPLCTARVGSIEVPERDHPSLLVAIARFQNEGWTDYIAEQCALIRLHSDKPITTNMTGLIGAMDWASHNRLLDRVGASMYADRRYYHHNLPRFDRLRAEKDYAPYWLLETAPNWSGGGRTFNIHYDKRGVRLYSWLSVFLGGAMVLYWQWREHRAGQEMLHGTCCTATGRWRPNKDTWAQLASHFKAHREWLMRNPPQQARLALVMSTESAWAFSIDPTDSDMRYADRFRDHIYMPVVERQLWRDVIAETADFAPYRVICMPLMPMIAPSTRARLERWVAAGGTLVLGPLSCIRTEEFTVPTRHEFCGMEPLIGGSSDLRFTVQWVEDQVWVDFASGARTRTRTLCEAFAPQGAEVIARYEGGYGDGLPAALDNSYGRGRVITLGCMVDDITWGQLVQDVCADNGIAPLCQSEDRVVVVPRADATGTTTGYAVANLGEEPASLTLPSGGTDLLSGADEPAALTLQGYDVMLLRL